MVCFCAAFVCFVFLFGNYVKDEPPKENTLWMVQRETDINGNLAKVKFKLRISRWFSFFLSMKGVVNPKVEMLSQELLKSGKTQKALEK